MRAVLAIVIALVVLVPLCGCGHRAAPAPKAKPTAVTQKPLPEWAPKHPSPAFLRAWRVLKPMPTEQKIKTNVLESGFSEAEQDRIRRILWPASYEFFGTLTDQQIASFLSKKEVSVPYRSLRGSQLKALERWIAASDESGRGGPPEGADHRVLLIKYGANKDFSNVRVGFATHDTHVVGVCFWIVRSSKEKPLQMVSDFAQI